METNCWMPEELYHDYLLEQGYVDDSDDSMFLVFAESYLWSWGVDGFGTGFGMIDGWGEGADNFTHDTHKLISDRVMGNSYRWIADFGCPLVSFGCGFHG